MYHTVFICICANCLYLLFIFVIYICYLYLLFLHKKVKMCYKRDCHGRYFIIKSEPLYIYNYIYNMYIYTHVNYKILLIILYDIVFTYYPLAAKVTYVPLK